MFGLSWGQIAIIVLVGVFVLGPERIPTAVTWVLTNLRKLRSMAAGAQAELRKEIGPELEELRRQVADLQSLKEIQELRDLRDLHPKRLIGKNILGDEFSGGITGFLGLNQPVAGPANPGNESTATPRDDAPAANGGVSAPNPGSGAGPSMMARGNPGGGSSALNGSGAANGSTALNGTDTPNQTNTLNGSSATPGQLPTAPSTTKLAAPKVVGGTSYRVVARAVDATQRPPFDPDGT